MQDKSTFTPGPLELEETEDGHVIRMGKAIENPSCFPVHLEIEYKHGCLLDGEDGDVFEEAEIKQAEEARANALLIAAAPEMYEALKITIDRLDDGSAWSDENLDQIKSVISRAQGGESQ